MSPSTLALLVLLSACAGAPAPGPEAPRRANVLVVTLDTTRADRLAPYGGPPGATPTITRLAAEGTHFTRAYTVTPLTIPAHSSLHTGLLPPRHGVRDNGDFFLAEGAVTLAERLHDAGYATMASVGAEVTSRHWGFAQGFDAYFDDMGVARKDRNRWAIERRADAVVDDAMGWIVAQPAGGPWFGWVHLFDAHHPYEAPEPFASQHAERPYLAEIAWTDSQLGRLVDLLDQRGELDHTWIVVLADHGEGLGAHGEGLHGALLYDTTTRIPLVVRPPGGRAEVKSVGFPVSIVDIVPTVLAAVGQPVPDGLDGMDLTPWLSGAAPEPRTDRAVYVESLYAWRHYGWAPQRAVVDPVFKLVDGPRPELYGADDPDETSDLSAVRGVVVRGLQRYVDEHYATLRPDAGVAAEAGRDADQLAQLEALGYLTTAGSAASDAAPFRTDLPSPAEHLPVLRRTEVVRERMQAGDLVAAEAEARKLLEVAPGLEQVRLQLATVLARTGRLDEALAVASALDAERPSANSRALVGTLLLRRGDPGAGVQTLADALDLDPYLVDTWLPYLLGLWAMGDTAAFSAEVRRAHERLPTEPVIDGFYGVVLALDGDREAAGPVLEAAIARDPNLPIVHEALGRLRLAQGDPVRAEAHLAAEVERHPPALTARRQLVAMFAEQARYTEQLEQLDAVVSVERPPAPDTAWSRAQARFNAGDAAGARDEVERCLTLAPDLAGCWMLKANVLAKLGDLPAAEAAAAEARRLAAKD